MNGSSVGIASRVSPFYNLEYNLFPFVAARTDAILVFDVLEERYKIVCGWDIPFFFTDV